MKRISNIIRTLMTLSVSCLLFIECTVSEVDDIYSGFPFIELETESINIAKTTQTVEIPIKTNRKLSFKTTSNTDTRDWLKSSLSDDGSSLNITAAANTLETSRSAVIVISTANDLVKREIKVVQDASGELTIQGDLILKSHQEVLDNSYTKTRAALILGNVSSVTKAADGLQCGDYHITVSESDIVNESVDTVTKKINQVDGSTLIIAKTRVTEFPSALIQKNDIKKVYLDYNAISAIPSADVLKGMELRELSLKGNKLSDISSLSGCTTLTHLDIAFNDIYTLDHLDGLTNLKRLDISGLPIPSSHVEVFLENHPGWEIWSSSLKQEASKLAVIDKTDINLISATQASLSAKILNNNGGSIKEVGFYVGKSNKINEMTKYVGTYTAGTNTITFIYDNGKDISDEMFVRSYAINETGISYGPRGRLGDPHNYGNVFLKSETEISTFYHDNYLYVEGSVVVGSSDWSGDVAKGDVLFFMNDGTSQYLKPSDIADISMLSKLETVRDGLYIANTRVEDFSVVSDIRSTPKMWLNANRMSSIPSLGNVEGLRELNLSRNMISDFTPLLGLTGLETLYLGFSETPGLETNDIGMLAGLEKMTGLRYLDLSGLPIIEKQVKDLRTLMPNCTIVFNAADRPAHLPTVKTGNVTRGDGFVTLNSTLVYNGKTNVTEYGFYIGKDLAAMEKVPVGGSISDQTAFSYQFTSEEDSDFYFYPYAVNSLGEGIDLSYKKFNMFSNNLSQYGTSNCYIVSEAGTYSFDASVKGNSTESVGSVASVEVLWETDKTNTKASTGHVVSDIELQGKDVIITTTGQEGNALVAVKDALGTILWSWHIWATDTPGNMNYVSSGMANYYVMDRNVGATRNDKGTGNEWKESVGTLYQWGRKDPFVKNLYTIASKAYTSVEQSIANPTQLSSQSSNSWLSPQDYTLWSANEKTKYDPCPPGYRVANIDVYSCLKASGSYDHGQYFLYNGKDKSWYPGTPHTDCFGSYMNESGGYGYMWPSTATKTSTSTNSIHFTSSSYSTNSTRSNGDSYPVRCMREHDINVTLSTTEVTGVAKNSATVSGVVEYIGNVNLTELGFVYSSSTDSPNVNSTKVTTSIAEGTFSKTLTGLKPGTRYYVRSFAAEGDIIAYGNVITFTTPMSGGTEGLPEEDYEWE